MNYFNRNQKWIFLEIINKFFLTKLKSYNLVFKLEFRINFNLKIISVHYLILTFFSVSKTIIFHKAKSNTICVFLKQNSTKYSINFFTKLKTESLLTIHEWVVNKTFLTVNLKNIILSSKLEFFYNLLNIPSKLYLHFFIKGAYSQKVLIFILRKVLKFLKING